MFTLLLKVGKSIFIYWFISFWSHLYLKLCARYCTWWVRCSHEAFCHQALFRVLCSIIAHLVTSQHECAYSYIVNSTGKNHTRTAWPPTRIRTKGWHFGQLLKIPHKRFLHDNSKAFSIEDFITSTSINIGKSFATWNLLLL